MFLVQVEGKSSLLVKQSTGFLEPWKSTTIYGVDKPADFKRSKDVYYIMFNDVKCSQDSDEEKRISWIPKILKI